MGIELTNGDQRGFSDFPIRKADVFKRGIGESKQKPDFQLQNGMESVFSHFHLFRINIRNGMEWNLFPFLIFSFWFSHPVL